MNFGRTLISGTPHQSRQQPDGGNLLAATLRSRNFATWQKTMDYDTHHNRIIMGLKNIVNGLISPVNHFDLCSGNLHRQKFANSSMAGISNELLPARLQKQGRLKTAILGLGVDTSNLSQTQNVESREHSMDARTEAEIVAVHSSEDFPELHPAQDPCWLRTQNGSCSSVNRNSPATKNMKCNKQESECDSSEDSFVIFTDSGLPNCSSMERCDPSGLCNRSRQRQISECSDDSFVICFTEDAPEGVIEVLSDDDDDNDDDNADTESESESELASDEEDETEGQGNKDETDGITHFIPKTANCFLNSGETNQPDSGFDEQKPLKRVRFNLKPEVHMMYVWNYAYRASRRGHWDMYARDRDRFQRRIENLADILNPILDRKHRERIYQTRYCDNTNMDQLEPLERKDTRT